ncbi:MAG: multifunctional oxoglutarate decarboxylase/oxoglutarate dehydrogenase thiamine pyrophosphate-binding subunit/dihydrolipoyllysine-residue succinyltransferase subunit [Acidobacteriaceae bacterium]|nr:multifunctional oxoglutarate decarboxylase/oxoglutarate dehydrogenase thiamine pyrophosphate-binding subunit/dihydrolipoyllysine-residue succinyltransferase subunit [Acidobacteriaceae bacterium]MBV9766412.1 multifunctional oxoglutarate decarboxylase/oxoglutarate dehydrogenase thiamine pyrophosphate-binding subunit/dihydrolipoyllysine-residue succinyltransferase subunit [Acidobacteriaceae bacterium]
MGINSWLEDELYHQYQFDRKSVDEGWTDLFDEFGHNGGPAVITDREPPEYLPPAQEPPEQTPPEREPPIETPPQKEPPQWLPPEQEPPQPTPTPQERSRIAASPSLPAENGAANTAPTAVAKTTSSPPAAPESKTVGANDQLIPLRGAAARIAENMIASLSIPVATSQRQIPVRVIEENRSVINKHRALQARSKLSFTHLIAWAIVKALKSNPSLNQAYAENGGEAFRVVHSHVNIGLAVDVAGKDGVRSLKVPNIKNADGMNFAQFVAAYDDIVVRARNNKLQVSDFEGTTISLTNPGTVGTLGSVPRLMPGQGAIIATGVIDYPAEFAAASEETRAMLGLSKVLTITCTYDHRIIQGAESGAFLAKLQQLLLGEDGFYDAIFRDLKIPSAPVRWQTDQPITPNRYAQVNTDVAKEAAVIRLIISYRIRGHLLANTNPLGREPAYEAALDPASYGLTIWDLDRPFLAGAVKAPSGAIASYMQPYETLREILDRLRTTYCGSIGVEYLHIQNPEQRQWLQDRMEGTMNAWKLEDSLRLRILSRLVQAEEFEHFLQTRFVGQKRFGLEGLESTIAVLDEILERAANGNAHEAVIGMAHRGRLNVLANVIGKSMAQVFSEFEGEPDPESVQGSGDVKYHLGASGIHTSTQGKEILVSVAFNPSHLEAVDPVVQGLVRPKQDRLEDHKRERVIPILIHGDAAFIGQGVVAETLQLSQLDGYKTGGTIHLVTDNQIGFTTNPLEGRSSVYCTDVALSVQAPILHVNGDDPDACIRAAQLAYDYRQCFKRDVVIDVIGYRRYGHNEADDPSYTQPVMYRKIKTTPTVATQYSDQLIRDKLINQEYVDNLRKQARTRLDQTYDEAKKNREQFVIEEFADLSFEQVHQPIPSTAADYNTLAKVITGSTTLPEDFHLHPKLKSLLDRRREALKGVPIDWGFAETLAFGSLVLEGTPVRLAGQDVSRGTFTQRHLEFSDYESGETYVPLKHLDPKQAKFEVVDSLLSEYAAMGFEFGYSVADPLTLVLWEAQFGDFGNGAQIIIDQFIVSAEAKWNQPSGLVLLLPHGLEGQGPEHSSARIERFLELCAEDNLQVCNCTTPAQYFHLLRRQMYGGADRRGVRKPLIIFTPKFLLRFPKAASRLDDLTSGAFQEVIGDTQFVGNQIRRILLCSGKIYYDLVHKREELSRNDVAIIRVEQLYPFPLQRLIDILRRYSDAAELFWVQEEPENMGAWYFVEEQMQSIINPGGDNFTDRRQLRYVGRPTAASPASGAHKVHHDQQEGLVSEAFATTPSVVRKARRLVRKKR